MPIPKAHVLPLRHDEVDPNDWDSDQWEQLIDSGRRTDEGERVQFQRQYQYGRYRPGQRFADM